jgi:hypothetical protein
MKTGHRRLYPGEMIEAGDEYLSTTGQWVPAPVYGVLVPDNDVVWARSLVGGILWRVFPSLIKEDDGRLYLEADQPVIQLAWGWTAGMSPKELMDIAEDSPRGSSEVQVLYEDAVWLRDQLNELIKACEQKS